jgi:arabinogalactan endo-1,4-beta-galactosidase
LVAIFESVKSKDINVQYVQVGNEISNGLLLPYLGSPYEYVDFIKTAHYLCRQYFPAAKIVLHTDLSYSSEKACAWYELIEKQRVDYDLIGLSYYPVWHGPLKQLEKTVTDVSELTGKKVILCEIGYMNTEQKTSAWFGHWKCDDIPYSPEGQKQYLEYFKSYIQNSISQYLHPEMFYWGMFSHSSKEHYPVALFDRHGNALPAFYEINGGAWKS